MDLNPGSIFQIKATRTQVGIIRTSKVYEGLEIQQSELTLIHDVFDTHESHSIFIYSFCDLQTTPLEQLMESFALKTVATAFVYICTITIFGEFPHKKIILSCPFNHTQLLHWHEMMSNVSVLYIFYNFKGHPGMSYFDAIQMYILPLRIMLLMILHLRMMMM